MGDLHGGQMIKKVIDAPHTNLDFENIEELKTKIRLKLNDNLAEEANVAFDWAIRIMKSYDEEFSTNE
jgi:heme oxygenase